ncbi:MAG: DUF3089 domain-containing protein [Bacteroidales bacterium]
MKNCIGFISFVFCFSCLFAQKIPLAPNYTQEQAWYQGFQKSKAEVDVFYIYPTVTFDTYTDVGDTVFYMDVFNPKQRTSVEKQMKFNQEVIAADYNFFAPYYRQITLENWIQDKTIYSERLQLSIQDIQAAFAYYMKNLNQGRPFILMGHSQGSKIIIELLKKGLTAKETKQFIVAYAIGFSLDSIETTNYPSLVPAKDSVDLGVLIAYNTICTPTGIMSVLANNYYCINPISWTCDTTISSKNDYRGHVKNYNWETGTYELDTTPLQMKITKENMLYTSDLNPQDYKMPLLLRALFPLGSLHTEEVALYAMNIKYNMAQRVRAFQKAQRKK